MNRVGEVICPEEKNRINEFSDYLLAPLFQQIDIKITEISNWYKISIHEEGDKRFRVSEIFFLNLKFQITNILKWKKYISHQVSYIQYLLEGIWLILPFQKRSLI